jgi:Ca2+-binding EF-hand superfamily protein
MTMSTISSVSSSSTAWAALHTQRSQHQAKMYAKVDTDSSGGVDQAELATMLTDVSKKTGVSLGDSKELFTQMDSNADGSLSSDELAKGMQTLMPPPPSTMDFAQSRGTQSGTQGGAKGGDGDGDQDDLFSKVDANSDGSVDATELKLLTDKIKSDTGQDVSAQFSKLDTDSDGKLSQAEFEAGKPQGPQGAGDGQSVQGANGPSGPPPAGGPGGPGGAGGTQGASGSDTTYDPLDTNQDGTVSELERLVGELQSASSSAGSSDEATSTAAKFDIAELAQKIYTQVAQGLSGATAGSGSLLSTSA